MAAFATASGGTIRIGVSNNGGRVGVQIDNRTLEDLANYIRNNTFPRRAQQDTATSSESVLRNMNLLVGDEPCNAAALFFTKNPGRYVVEAQVMCARFLGTDSVRFLDERSFSGDVFSQLEEALAFVARNTRQQPVITGRAEREVVPEYPADAGGRLSRTRSVTGTTR